MSSDTPAPAGVTPDRYVAVQQSEEFSGLRRALRSFVFPMTAAFFLWYALYVILSAYARDFMATRVVGNINVALVFGLLQFVSTFLIAWLYSRFADRKLDPVADRIRAELDGTPERAGAESGVTR
jgi:Predicted membrane protein